MINTQGLVLHTTKYGETSIIAKVFTRDLGMNSYIIKGVRSSGGKTKQNLMQPLSHLDMTVYDNPKKEIQYIKEMHPAGHYNGLVSSGVKLALLFFFDELLYKSLKEQEPNERLFDYAVEELRRLDTEDEDELASFPIELLINTSRYIGIEPMNNYSHREPYFNLKEGRFLSAPSVFAVENASNMDYYLDAVSSAHMHSYLSCTLSHSPMPRLTANQRATTLNNLLDYYNVHLSDFKNFKSHQVLHSVLR